MKYKEIKIQTVSEALDPLTLLLEQKGITGLVINDPRDAHQLMEKKEAWHWDYIDSQVLDRLCEGASLTFYTEEDADLTDILEELTDFEIQVSLVDDQDWLHKWKDYFFPARVTPQIVVKPAWAEYQKQENDIVIAIDPGMAFGTGTHPTTKLCLRLLEKYMDVGDLVLDVGSGTGILSVAAALLGSRHVLSVDLDPEAIKSTIENAKLNGVSELIDVRHADLTKGLNFSADIVVSNLMADLIILLSKDVAGHLKGKSVYIAGGILSEKEGLVRAALLEAGFCIESVIYEEEWCAIAARLQDDWR